MNQEQSGTQDPICGMTVDPTTALHAEHEGETFYFSVVSNADRSF